MFLHIIVAAALLSAGPHSARAAAGAVAFVYRIPGDAQTLRLMSAGRQARPVADRTHEAASQPLSQHRFTLTTQLRR